MNPGRSKLPDRPPQPVYPDATNVARSCAGKFGGVAEVRPGETRFRAECRLMLRTELQLRNAILERQAFEGFKEADPAHLPYVLDSHLDGDPCLNDD